jgi:membrane protein YdbS with pleckstrin-like domain
MLDGDECTCKRPLDPAVVRRRQIEAALNAVIFGVLSFGVLSLLHVSNTTVWGVIVALVAYVFYLWLLGRQLRREGPK